VVQEWKTILILLCVEIMNMPSTFNNIFSLMVKSFQDFGGLGLEHLGGKMVNMGCDGINVF